MIKMHTWSSLSLFLRNFKIKQRITFDSVSLQISDKSLSFSEDFKYETIRMDLFSMVLFLFCISPDRSAFCLLASLANSIRDSNFLVFSMLNVLISIFLHI